ncbi:MAG: C10 family peptidase, partial [Muribaculaceae bacterium]|nr:C10 family peptidase [Muribaculaceae bacterium]
MKKRTILLWSMLAMMATTLPAAQVSQDKALDIAQRFANKGTATFKAKPGSELMLAHAAKSADGKPDYYVFNRGDHDGFIIVSGEDRVEPVWGYCERGEFDYDKLPCNFKWWLGEYQRQMQYLREHPQVKARKAVNLTTSVAPLLTSKWNQCKPFNDLCPVAEDDDDRYWVYGGRACSGCVATAVSQIMYYYKWPASGVGSKTYDFYLTTQEGQVPMTLSCDFSQSTYQWNLMKDEYLYMDKNNYGYFDENWHVYIKVIDENGDTITDPNGVHSAAVAKLLSDVGIACEMMYGYSGSGAYTYNAYYALLDHFKYQVGYAYRDEYNGDWDELLRGWLDYHYPLYLSGHGSGGHAFVLDGYDNGGRFHVNWGWGGWYDGYFESLALNPDGGDDGYNSYQEVIASEPNRPFITVPDNNEAIDFGSLQMGDGVGEVTRQIAVYGRYAEHDVAVTIVGDDAEMFQTVDLLPIESLDYKNPYYFNVYYRPTAAGQHTAQLVLDAGGDYEPVVFTLTGEATQAYLYYDVNLDGV